MPWRVAVASRNALGECVTWDAAGQRLFWCDIEGRTLHRLDPADGGLQQWALPVRCGSFALTDVDSALLLALEDRVSWWDLAAGTERPLTHLPHAAGLRANDGRCDRQGRFVFGTMDETGGTRGRFWQYCAQRGLRRIEGLPDVTIPNGLAFTGDGKAMYWTDSRRGTVYRGAYDSDGARVSGGEVFAQAPAGAEPDGACVDTQEGLWMAHWGAAQLVRYDREGRLERTVGLPVRQPTCVTFGGDGNSVLFVSSAALGAEEEALAGHIFALETGVAGLQEPVFRTSEADASRATEFTKSARSITQPNAWSNDVANRA